MATTCSRNHGAKLLRQAYDRPDRTLPRLHQPVVSPRIARSRSAEGTCIQPGRRLADCRRRVRDFDTPCGISCGEIDHVRRSVCMEMPWTSWCRLYRTYVANAR